MIKQFKRDISVVPAVDIPNKDIVKHQLIPLIKCFKCGKDAEGELVFSDGIKPVCSNCFGEDIS